MQEDFHYYATYCAAYLAGYTHEECLEICYSAQFVDCCSKTLLSGIKAPPSAATTQLQLELMDARTDPVGLQDITRIWASFHFLPADLYAEKKATRRYRSKYRMICGPNGDLLIDTVSLAKGKSLQAVGIAMHVLADTWAHRYFAGTPSLVINNVGQSFTELIPEGDSWIERPIVFNHNPNTKDDLEKGFYTNSLYQNSEQSVMNLGHGRAGHLPDYSFIRYRYMPAWDNYREVVKDNPDDYYHAFCQMVYALQVLHGDRETFEKEQYAWETVEPWREEIRAILEKRQPDACLEWELFGEKLSGRTISGFDQRAWLEEYRNADDAAKDSTFLGRFILAALAQKSMVTNKIFRSGNLLAGYSVDIGEKGFKGIRDFRMLIAESEKRSGT